MRMTIKMPNPKGLSNIDLEKRIAACAKAAQELKMYRIALSEESDKRQQKPPNRGGNPVVIDLTPAEMTAEAQTNG